MARLIIILAALFLYACGTGVSVRKSKVKYLDGQLSGTFDNNAFKVNGCRYGSPTLLDLFEIYQVRTDSVSVAFDGSGALELAYTDNDGEWKKDKLKGSFTKKGYYEVFLRNDKKEIPPFFSIIYGRYNVNRIRMVLTTEGDLIIDNTWDESANILFLGVGDKGRRQSFFRQKL
ncbi:hypothetical protein [Dawidia soli]|uniref:Lipoprotein n=1 Tax=Dawidia soli TaxID=2782352 RepID=A0AAP2GIC8_9BACT|nr:hypothetical protein [Dawidia soli]MBT1686843.1 hypothetical protein [Dawidia soli]